MAGKVKVTAPQEHKDEVFQSFMLEHALVSNVCNQWIFGKNIAWCNWFHFRGQNKINVKVNQNLFGFQFDLYISLALKQTKKQKEKCFFPALVETFNVLAEVLLGGGEVNAGACGVYNEDPFQ